jgi:DNA-binding response OmpR family regulator
MRVLLVEDDYQVGETLLSTLRMENYAVDWVRDGAEVLPMLEAGEYEMMVLDLGLPNMSGIEILKKVRSQDNPTPILLLTARDSVQDKVMGFDLGADDYLTKPFDMDELLARIRSLVRRSAGRTNPMLCVGDVEFDPKENMVRKGGEIVSLSAKEMAVLEALMSRAGRFVSKSRLQESLYAWEDEIGSNTIEVYISRLRKFLGKDLIETLRGVGYRVPKE